jgi:spore photoproduct lyase
MLFPIDQIWIDDDAQDEPMTGQILRRLPQARVLMGKAREEASRALLLEPDPLARGKRILRLMRHRGAFVKPCPGTPEYVCCGLQILHIGQGCPMDCRYCALQAYFNRPVLEVFVNADDLMEGLRRHLEDNPDRFHRICTGEFADSLALDPLTGLAERLVQFFSRVENASLEIKTKTDYIEPLLDLDPHGRVVLSFSVNAPEVSKSEERRAAPLRRRLDAAARARDKGYRLGFHFDPIIPMPGWEDAYARTVDDIFETVGPDEIAWISLGVLRYVPELKEAVRGRFGPVPYFHDAFQRGLDGKSRLNVQRRIAVYRRLSERIGRSAPDCRVYLCMESPYVWEQSLGLRISSDEDLTAYLDDAMR